MEQRLIWVKHYVEVVDHMLKHRRRPSKHVPEELKMHHWMKQNKKLMNAGKMADERVVLFTKLLEIASLYRRKNQYAYQTDDYTGVGTLEFADE